MKMEIYYDSNQLLKAEKHVDNFLQVIFSLLQSFSISEDLFLMAFILALFNVLRELQ